MSDPLLDDLAPDDLDRIAMIVHPDPHRVLGAHVVDGGVVIRAHRPDAVFMRVLPDDPDLPARVMTALGAPGLFGALYPEVRAPFRYQLEIGDHFGQQKLTRDAYAFLPTLGALDLHLAAEGTHHRLHEKLGVHVQTLDGVRGASFAVWAPNAQRVSVVGDFNEWDGRFHPMRFLAAAGIWELFIPDLRPGTRYKFEVLTPAGRRQLKLDPFAFQTELRPNTAGVIPAPSTHRWTDHAWVSARDEELPRERPLSIYEVHLASWMREPTENDRWLTYRELGQRLGDYVVSMGFTHVELLPVAEHPLDASWGYQVTGYFAPTARHGEADDFRAFVDAMHARGIGVIVDWVPAHFPKDAHALARFDGTALYEHADPRLAEHPDWGTLVFNYGRNEVRNFLLANALYWLDEFHIDGLRVDAVASMLYLDYSRQPGEWVPNRFGGRENLEAIAFLRELNDVVHAAHPGSLVLAEESTAWPMVSRPTYLGGLGFTFKWNMGWMHDTLAYFAMDPLFRQFHHDKVTFGITYAFSENFVLPLSHDEVVHLKGSLLARMPGDRWQRFANLRLLLGHQWMHPGKKLLFMGGEFGQPTEWNFERSLPWELLEQPFHRGVQQWVRDLNRVYREHPALWETDGESEGFHWAVVGDREQSVFAFLRFDRARKQHVLCVLNATPVVRPRYRIGVPSAGYYREVLNSDASAYGGSNVGNQGGFEARVGESHGFGFAAEITLPPLGIVVFASPPMGAVTVGPAGSTEPRAPEAIRQEPQ